MKKYITILLCLLLSTAAFSVRAPSDHLLITEVATISNSAEYIEIYNPTNFEMDLSNVYLTDATTATLKYYNIVTGSDFGGADNTDFHVKFPDGTKIGPKEYLIIAMRADYFYTVWGFYPDFEIGCQTDTATNMIDVSGEGTPDGSPGLTDTSECVILYYWDGVSNHVKDLDYFIWGINTNVRIDKTGVSTFGHEYADDTSVNSQVAQITMGGATGLRYFTYQRVDYLESTEKKLIGGNGIYGDDETSENFLEAFQIAVPTPGYGYSSDKHYTYNIVGSFKTEAVFDVDLGIYPEGTTSDEIIFGMVSPLAIFTTEDIGFQTNYIFDNLMADATYTLFGWGEGKVSYSAGEFTQEVTPGKFFITYSHDTITLTNFPEGLVNDGNVLFEWAAYTDSNTGRTADTYVLKIFDGTNIETHVTTLSELTVNLPNGEYHFIIEAISATHGYIGLTEELLSFEVFNVIDTAYLTDQYILKVEYTAPIDDMGDVDVDGIIPMGINFDPGNDYAEFVFADPFTWGNTYTLTQKDMDIDGTLYSETLTFTALSNFNLISATPTWANIVELVFSQKVDIVTGENSGSYSVKLAEDDVYLIVVSAVADDNKVILTFQDNFEYGQAYEVSSADVLSENHNPINDHCKEFELVGEYLELDDIVVLRNDYIRVYFNANVNVASAQNTASYTITPTLGISAIIASGDNVRIYFTDTIERNVNYTLTANIIDVKGMPIDQENKAGTFMLQAVYPELTKAEMVDQQTIKVYFNKPMCLDPDEYGYIKDSWVFFVHTSDWSSYHFVNNVDYNIEEKTALIYLDSIMEMGRDDYVVLANGFVYFLYYSVYIYAMDNEGYTVNQSGKYSAEFSTEYEDLDLVFTYPSPASTYVTFSNLVGSGKITLYTVNGVKVKEIDFDEADGYEKYVELKNNRSNLLTPGVYFYRIESDKLTKTGTIGILR